MDDLYIGNLVLFAGNFVPKNCFLCDGSMLLISKYAALFSLIGNQYGGDGKSTFALPDLQGRSPVGFGRDINGNYYPMGTLDGRETETLTINQIPAHSHILLIPNNILKIDSITVNAGTDASTAVNTPFDNYWGEATPVFGQGIKSYTSEPNVDMSNYALGAQEIPYSNLGNLTLENTGNSLSHDNMPPYVALMKWLIVWNGLYPTRS